MFKFFKMIFAVGALVVIMGAVYYITTYTTVMVSGHSMDPTLVENERYAANKKESIKRFDIVVFNVPDGDKYVKRVIGMPGDVIEFKNDQLYINGKQYDEPYLAKYKAKFVATFTQDFSSKNLLPGTQGKIPNNCYFVMGDNRQASKDSREIGVISQSKIFGVLDFEVSPNIGQKVK